MLFFFFFLLPLHVQLDRAVSHGDLLAKGIYTLPHSFIFPIAAAGSCSSFIRTVTMPTRRHGGEPHHSLAPSSECYQCRVGLFLVVIDWGVN
jgi:hypothetical protein